MLGERNDPDRSGHLNQQTHLSKQQRVNPMDERGYLPTIFLKQPDPQEYAYRPVYLSIISSVIMATEARLTRSTVAR
jgi:hypothetical protein